MASWIIVDKLLEKEATIGKAYQKSRVDNKKTKVARIVFKIPQFLAADKRIVRTQIYKSKKYEDYNQAFLTAHDTLLKIFEDSCVKYEEEIETSLFYFSALHFPK